MVKRIIRFTRILLVALILGVLVIPSIPLFKFTLPVKAPPADVFWVGGAGTWSDATNHWAAASGGAPGAGNLPDSTSTVHFDANSFSGAGQVVTIDAAASMNSMDWTGATNNPTLTIGGVADFAVSIYGSLTLIAAMSFTETTANSVTLDFLNTAGGKTITTNGITIPVGIKFNGAGGGWTLQDTLTVSQTTWPQAINLVQGTLDTNGRTVNLTSGNATFYVVGALTRVLTLGASVINISSSWNAGTNPGDLTNFTLNEGTSSIRLSSAANFSGNGETYYEVQLNGTAHDVRGTNTFTTLTRTGTATFTDSVTFYGNQTITGTLTLAGNAAHRRLLVQSNTVGTARTLTAAVVSVSNADFQDITGAGAGSWDLSAITGRSGNLGGNSGITFTTGANQYWVGNTGNWSTVIEWASATGGVGATGRVPLPQDTAIFDANSFSASGNTVTVDEPRISSINTTGVTNAPTFSGATFATYGSVTLIGVTWSITTTQFYGRGSNTLTTNGVIIGGGIDMGSSTNLGIGGTVTLQDTLNMTGATTLYAGTLNLNNQNVTATTFDSATTTYARTLTLGNGIITLNSTAATTKWTVASTNLTFNVNYSTIKLTNSSANAQSFTGSGLTYYNVTIAGAGNYTMTFNDANTFNSLTVDRSQAAKTISGNVILTTTELSLPISSTTVVTITNTDFTQTVGTVSSDYLSISGSVAIGGANFYAGTHSTDGGSNSGWIFGNYTMQIPRAGAFLNYIETGDMLFVAEVINVYTPHYPNGNPSTNFQLQLLATNKTTILGATPLRAWEDVPLSIYFDASTVTALSLTEGTAYYLKMVGTFTAPANVFVYYQLADTDWHGTNMDALDQMVRGIAASMNAYHSWAGTANDILTTITGVDGPVLTDEGGSYFITGIPALAVRRPALFETYRGDATVTIGSANNQFDTITSWSAQVGTVITADANTFGEPFNGTGQVFLGFITMVAILFITMLGLAGGGKVLPLLLLSVPLLVFGNQMRIIGIQFTVVISAAMFFLFVRQLFWKTV